MTQTKRHTSPALLRLFLLLFFALMTTSSFSQIQNENVNIIRLKVEDGLAMSRVDDIVCDAQNIIWIKTSRGLQFWDGQTIQTFEDSVFTVGTFFQMYPHPDDGILVAMPGLLRHITFEGLKDRIVYSKTHTEFIPIPFISDSLEAILIHPDSILYKTGNGNSKIEWVDKESSNATLQKRLYQINGNRFLVDLSAHATVPIYHHSFNVAIEYLLPKPLRNTIRANSETLLTTTKSGLALLQGSTSTTIPYPNNASINFYSSILMLNNNKALVGMNNQLFEFDISSQKWTRNYKTIDQKNLMQNGYFDKMISDHHGNIWAITVNEGLLKIYKNDFFTYFGSPDNKINFVKNIVVDEEENKILYSALNGGIVVYDTLGNLINNINTTNSNGLVKQVTGIYKIENNQYIFNNHKDSLIYHLSFDKAKANIRPILSKNESYVYYQDAIPYDANTSYLLFNTLYKLVHSPFRLTKEFLYTSTKSCLIREKEHLWIGAIDGILDYDIHTQDYTFISLPNQGYVRSIALWKDDQLVLGTDKGLSLYDKKTQTTQLIKEGCIYCLLSDSEFNVWAGSGEGLYKMDASFKMTQYTLEDGIQNEEFNTNACVQSASGKMYFGGVNGITAFDPTIHIDQKSFPSLYIKSLTEGSKQLLTNSNISAEKKYQLSYDQNNLNIAINSIGKYESANYNYQYYVKGIHSKWIDAKKQTQYNFNLAPGTYTFYFSASSTFDPNAALKHPLQIEIKSPWWKQWWFYVVSSLALIGIIGYIISSLEKQKYLKKKYEWELAYQRQEDRINLSKELHDNIGSRLTFLVSSIENIKKAFGKTSTQAEEKIDQITNFGKDTIEDLRSMMWVLNQKFITIQDLQLKVLDYLNIAQNTYKTIDIQYDGPQDNLDTPLESKLSQNIFRVIQEAIHNCIKHAEATKIKINITQNNSILSISIADNGKGFDNMKIVRGHGLRNMKARLAEHDTILHIESEEGKGTHLSFDVKLNKQA